MLVRSFVGILLALFIGLTWTKGPQPWESAFVVSPDFVTGGLVVAWSKNGSALALSSGHLIRIETRTGSVSNLGPGVVIDEVSVGPFRSTMGIDGGSSLFSVKSSDEFKSFSAKTGQCVSSIPASDVIDRFGTAIKLTTGSYVDALTGKRVAAPKTIAQAGSSGSPKLLIGTQAGWIWSVSSGKLSRLFLVEPHTGKVLAKYQGATRLDGHLFSAAGGSGLPVYVHFHRSKNSAFDLIFWNDLTVTQSPPIADMSLDGILCVPDDFEGQFNEHFFRESGGSSIECFKGRETKPRWTVKYPKASILTAQWVGHSVEVHVRTKNIPSRNGSFYSWAEYLDGKTGKHLGKWEMSSIEESRFIAPGGATSIRFFNNIISIDKRRIE